MPLSAGSEQEWVAPSWEEVVREYTPQVYRLAYRLTGHEADAQDLTQEVFIRVFNALENYQPGTFAGWLHRITTNLFLDQARRKQRHRVWALDQYEADTPRASDGYEPEREFEMTHLDLDIQSALADLPPDYRAAVVLRDIEDPTYEEIADVLGISQGTVRSRIHRGRARLRRALAHRTPRSQTLPGLGRTARAT